MHGSRWWFTFLTLSFSHPLLCCRDPCSSCRGEYRYFVAALLTSSVFLRLDSNVVLSETAREWIHAATCRSVLCTHQICIPSSFAGLSKNTKSLFKLHILRERHSIYTCVLFRARQIHKKDNEIMKVLIWSGEGAGGGTLDKKFFSFSFNWEIGNYNLGLKKKNSYILSCSVRLWHVCKSMWWGVFVSVTFFNIYFLLKGQ